LGRSHDETRQQVVLFGGSAAPSATATADDLFADTWERPPPARPGTPTTPPILVGFEVDPSIVYAGTSFVLEVLIDQPAPATTSVMVTGAGGSFVEDVQVAAGSTSGSRSVRAAAGLLPTGDNVLTATLDGVALTASLQVQ
jgi:hypothetical protein